MGAIVFALLCVPIGKLLGWYVTRRWKHLTVNPKNTFFPKLCPLCLSQYANESVDEKSPDRQTKKYIVAQRLEHWSASIPHCSRCKLRLDYGQAMAVGAGVVCAVVAYILLPPDTLNASLFCYILFGYPAYAAIIPLRKGVMLKSGGKNHLTVVIRNAQYYDAWIKGKPAGTSASTGRSVGGWKRYLAKIGRVLPFMSFPVSCAHSAMQICCAAPTGLGFFF